MTNPPHLSRARLAIPHEDRLKTRRAFLQLVPAEPSSYADDIWPFAEMSSRVIFALGVCLTACRPAHSPEHDLQKAKAALQHGNLQAARRLIASNTHLPDPVMRSRFDLLEAEFALAEGQASEALRRLGAPVPKGPDWDDRESQRLLLQADALIKLSRLEDAGKTLDEADARRARLKDADIGIELHLRRGLLLTILNRVDESRHVLEQARKAAEQRGNVDLTGAALNQLAVNSLRVFRYDEALTFAQQAEQAAQTAGNRRLLAPVLSNLGLAYARLGDFEKAHECAERAVKMREEMGDPMGLQAAVGSLGNLYLVQEKAAEAVPQYRRALELARRLKAESYASVWAANLAEALADAGDWDGAEQLNREARSAGFQDEQTRISAILTEAAVARGRKQSADAIALFNNVIRSKPANPAQRWEAHANLAALYAGEGAARKAAAEFESAIDLIAKTRAEVLNSEHRISFLSRLIRFYQDYVDFLMEQRESEKAFLVAERSRERIFAERVHNGKSVAVHATVSDYRTLAERLGARLASYWVAPRRSFLWVVGPEGVHEFTLPAESQIAKMVESFQGAVQQGSDPVDSGVSGESDRSARGRLQGPPHSGEIAAGAWLYSNLLAGARPLLPPGSKVIVVPDGPLLNLNLETLPAPGNGRHYWLEDVTISITPSLDLIGRAAAGSSESAQAAGRGSHKSGNSAGLAAARESVVRELRKSREVLVIGNPEQASEEYPRLPHAAGEIDSIRRSFPQATVLAGAAANASGYFEAHPERFSLIHFAAHGIANRTSPLDSAIVLSPHGGAFLLYARDVSKQTLNADVVTLAACRSAGARWYPGEGLVGLAWAFLNAGSKHVIASLWDVNDVATAQVVSVMYAALGSGEQPTDALRRAKLDLLQRGGKYRSPYYWGAFQDYIAAPAVRTR
jgi:tetratricopeptide (TPR) repeat protein